MIQDIGLGISTEVDSIQDALLKGRVDEAYTQLSRLDKPLEGMESFVCCAAAMQEGTPPGVLRTVLGSCERFGLATGAPDGARNYLCGECLVQFAVNRNRPAHLRLLLEHGASPNKWKEIADSLGDGSPIDSCLHTQALLSLTQLFCEYDPAMCAQNEGFLECRDLLLNASGRVQKSESELESEPGSESETDPETDLDPESEWEIELQKLWLLEIDESGTIREAEVIIDECFRLALLRLPYWDSLTEMLKEGQRSLALYHSSHTPKTIKDVEVEMLLDYAYRDQSLASFIPLLDALFTANETLLNNSCFQTFLASYAMTLTHTDELYSLLISWLERLPDREIILMSQSDQWLDLNQWEMWEKNLTSFTPVFFRDNLLPFVPDNVEKLRLFFERCRVKGEPPKGEISALAADILDHMRWQDPDMDFVALPWFLPGGFLYDEDVNGVLAALPASARQTRAAILAYRSHADNDIYTL